MKSKYESRVVITEAQRLFQAGKPAEAMAIVDKALAAGDISPDQVGRLTVIKCNCLLMQKNYQGAIDCAKKGLEKARGPSATILKFIIQQAEKQLQSQKGGNEQSSAEMPEAENPFKVPQGSAERPR